MTTPRTYYVYILASARHGTLYIGVCNDLSNRLTLHRAGRGSEFVKKYGVTRLVYMETHASPGGSHNAREAVEELASRLEDQADRGRQSRLERSLAFALVVVRLVPLVLSSRRRPEPIRRGLSARTLTSETYRNNKRHGVWVPAFRRDDIETATNQRDGQITSDLRKPCQAKSFRKSKIFLFSSDPNQCASIAIPSHAEGRWPSSRRGAGCGGR